MAVLSVITAPDGRTRAVAWRIGLTPATRSRAASPSHVGASTTVSGRRSRVSAASTGAELEPAAP